MQARNVSLALDGDGKTLKIETRFEVAAGGSAEGNVVLDTAGNSAELDDRHDARDLRVNIASGDVDDPEQIPPVGLSASLRSRGARRAPSRPARTDSCCSRKAPAASITA